MTTATAKPVESERDERPTEPLIRTHDVRRVLPLFGRVLLSAIFLVAAPFHFTLTAIEMAAKHGTPLPGLFVPLTGVIAAAGGVSLLIGYKAKTGGLLLLLFLIPVTFFMHRFWGVADPSVMVAQLTQFLKNAGLAGGVLAFIYFGAGPISIDARIARTHVRMMRKEADAT
jgi:putative oxidoreductase